MIIDSAVTSHCFQHWVIRGLAGTVMSVRPEPVCASTRHAVRPGGTAIVMSPDESATSTRLGTRDEVQRHAAG